MYKVIALAGKAGSGKDTILHEVIAAAPDRFHEIISATTRPPREGEVDGKDYYFLKPLKLDTSFAYDPSKGILGTFKGERIEFLEATNFNDWFYGTPKSSLVEDKVNIGVFNPAGLRSLSASPQVSLAIVYVKADDKIRLLRQLNRENDPDVKEIIRRFSADEDDFRNFDDEFKSYHLINNDTNDLRYAAEKVMTEADNAFGRNQLKDNL